MENMEPKAATGNKWLELRKSLQGLQPQIKYSKESVHVFFNDKKINALLDDVNQDLLHFKNKVCTGLNDSDDDNVVIKRNHI